MAILPSGLPEHVADDEDLARLLTQNNHFTATVTKRVAFMPAGNSDEASVSRHGREPADTLWALGQQAAGARPLKGAAFVKAEAVRHARLDAVADEPPPCHAAIRGWPTVADDPQERKAKRIELVIASANAAGPPLLR